VTFDRKAYMREYRKNNRERIREKNREWRRRNPDKQKAIQQRQSANPEYQEYMRQWRAENKERVRAHDLAWRERNPVKAKLSKQKDYQKNRDRYLASFAEWRRNNPERRRELHRAWCEANPERVRASRVARTARRRARERGANCPATIEQIAERIAYFGWRCWICSMPYEQVDHFKPLAKCGAHIACNLRPICGTCNLKKHARWGGVKEMHIWAARIGREIEEIEVAPWPEKEPRELPEPEEAPERVEEPEREPVPA
jgi:hypothetical protein